MRPKSNKAQGRSKLDGFPPRRTSANRPEKVRILIVGEGQETEPNYFRGLRDEPIVRERYAITVKGAHGFSQDAVVKETIKHKARGDYDEVWCIVDVEGPSKAENLSLACNLATKHNIILWLSNPCIEVWFLLHLVRQARRYNDGSAVEAALQKHWAKRFGNDYQKSDDNIYRKLRPLLLTAIEHAQWVLEKHHKADSSRDCNSSTDLYRAILRLMPDGIPDR